MGRYVNEAEKAERYYEENKQLRAENAQLKAELSKFRTDLDKLVNIQDWPTAPDGQQYLQVTRNKTYADNKGYLIAGEWNIYLGEYDYKQKDHIIYKNPETIIATGWTVLSTLENPPNQ